MSRNSDHESDPISADPIPEQIGPYSVAGRLGKGGMGEVYRGFDQRLGRPVALKRVLHRVNQSPRARQRFRREARTAAQLSHSAIVQVYDWVETEGQDWLVMEFVDGTPLSDLRPRLPLPLPRTLAMARQIAEGLAAAHRAGIVHRDLKPSNIMLARDGAKILDFGLAKAILETPEMSQSTLTQAGEVVGTVSAMSPEQALGETLDARSDLFSFGTLLYELLTGASPFEGRNAAEILTKIMSWEQPPAWELNHEVPERLSALVDRLLEKEPDDRPVDAGEVAAVLREIEIEMASGVFPTLPEDDDSDALAHTEAHGRVAPYPLPGASRGSAGSRLPHAAGGGSAAASRSRAPLSPGHAAGEAPRSASKGRWRTPSHIRSRVRADERAGESAGSRGTRGTRPVPGYDSPRASGDPWQPGMDGADPDLTWDPEQDLETLDHQAYGTPGSGGDGLPSGTAGSTPGKSAAAPLDKRSGKGSSASRSGQRASADGLRRRRLLLALLGVGVALAVGALFFFGPWNDLGPGAESTDEAALGAEGRTRIGTGTAGSAPGRPGSSGPSSGAPGSGAVERNQNRIVVLPFENRTGEADLERFGLIIADWLTQGLGRGTRLEVVPTDLAVRAARFAADQGQDGDPIDLALVADDTGAGTLISGAYYASGDQLILRGQINDAVEAKTVAVLSTLRTPSTDPIGVLDALERDVRARVATYLDPQLTTFGSLAASPPSYEVYDAFVQGMELFWQLDFPASIEFLDQAAEMAPEFAIPQLMAATAHLNLGQFAQVEPIIDRIERNRDELAPLDRLFLDWLRAESRGDYTGAARHAGRAAALAPLSGWIQTFGVDSLRANLPHQALDALAQLDPERGYARGWVPHFEYLTLAYHLTGDHEGELAAARDGAALYPRSMILLAAKARALAASDQPDEALAELADSTGLDAEFVHTAGLAMAQTATELFAHGHPEEGSRAAEMAIGWYRARISADGSSSRKGGGLIETMVAAPVPERAEVARLLLLLGQHDGARALFASLADDEPDPVEALGYRGLAAGMAGNRDEAEAALEALRGLDQPFLFGRDAYWRAAILARIDEPQQAVEQLRRAYEQGHPFVWPRTHPHIDPIWQPLREYVPFLDAIRPVG